MRSYDEQRQQKTPQGALSQEVAVKPQGTEIQGLSSSSAQIETPTCEGMTSLLEKVLERGNMLQALDRVESNKGAPGVDGIDVKSLRTYVKEHWGGIRQQLLTGTCKPQPVRRVEIPKPGGGSRGSWEMARNLNNAMDKTYFEQYGLRSLQERYVALRSAL